MRTTRAQRAVRYVQVRKLVGVAICTYMRGVVQMGYDWERLALGFDESMVFLQVTWDYHMFFTRRNKRSSMYIGPRVFPGESFIICQSHEIQTRATGGRGY